VAVIARGSIQALDTPEKLRALTSPSEAVHLKVYGLSSNVLARLLTSVLENPEFTTEGEISGVSFTRHHEDSTLDQSIRIIHKHGGTILGMDSERATLLDVLESYE
jgi:hypothetical protein